MSCMIWERWYHKTGIIKRTLVLFMGSALVSNNENPETGAIDTEKTMVGLSLEEYSKLTDSVEIALDKADRLAAENTERMSHEEVFGNLRRKINAQ